MAIGAYGRQPLESHEWSPTMAQVIFRQSLSNVFSLIFNFQSHSFVKAYRIPRQSCQTGREFIFWPIFGQLTTCCECLQPCPCQNDEFPWQLWPARLLGPLIATYSYICICVCTVIWANTTKQPSALYGTGTLTIFTVIGAI